MIGKLTTTFCLTIAVLLGGVGTSVGNEQNKEGNVTKRGLSCVESIRRTALENMILWTDKMIKNGCLTSPDCKKSKNPPNKPSWTVKNKEPSIYLIFGKYEVSIFSIMEKKVRLTYSDYRATDFYMNWADYSYNEPSRGFGVKIIDLVPVYRRLRYKLNRENLRLGVAREHTHRISPSDQKIWDRMDISGMSQFLQCGKIPPSEIKKIIKQKRVFFKNEEKSRKEKRVKRLEKRKF